MDHEHDPNSVWSEPCRLQTLDSECGHTLVVLRWFGVPLLLAHTSAKEADEIATDLTPILLRCMDTMADLMGGELVDVTELETIMSDAARAVKEHPDA